MFLLEERRLSFRESLIQTVELKFWDDVDFGILFDKIAAYF